MFNLSSNVPKSWQTVSRQADRVANEAAATNSVPHTGSQPAPRMAPPRDLGGVLRERREAMGASLAEVETATRIRQKYLAALEADEWHLLPGEVVGRGFLRNYAIYLGLDPTEVVERRRTVADPALTAALSGTSAGSPLPPERVIDYRPKDVLLKDEPEGIQQRELRVGPFFTVVLLVGVVALLWWLSSNFGGEISAGVNNLLTAVQARRAEWSAGAVTNPDDSTPLVVEPAVPVASAPQVNPSTALTTTEPITNPATNPVAPVVNVPAAVDQPPVEPNPEPPPAAVVTGTNDTPAGNTTILVPTDTPTVTPTTIAIATTVPTNTPTATSTAPPPTETPTAEPPAPAPVVAAAFCGDERMAIAAPGVGQVLSGAVSITGRAIHENLDYYKLEFAPGANAEGGYTYFDGNKGQVDGGILGTLNTGSLPNGEYTLQLTIVDLTGNYPPPCRVPIVIQN